MMQLRLKSFVPVVLGVSGVVLTGCGGMVSTVPVATPGVALHGNVHGGQQPVAGSTIQLYAAGNKGYGSGSTALLTKVVKTDAGGSFTITGDYQCPKSTTEVYVYLVATGGNPGLPNGSNANIGLMAALGPCSRLTASTYITVNELTTVASVWALSPFMSGIAGVGTSASNATGLTNAFATVNKLIDTSVGNLPGPALPAGATLPVQKMNLIADILANCVNSSGGVATDTSTPCGALFSAATVNGVAPTDTITAAMNLAQNPDASIAMVSGMVPAKSPFQPIPDSVPSDLSLVITYSGGALSTPSAIAADGDGNLWLSNAGNNTVSKLDAFGRSSADPTGFLSGATGFTTGPLSSPTAIAIDQNGYAWVTNGGNNTVAKISSDGSGSTLFKGGGLSAPSGVSIDADGNAWVANGKGASVTLITSSGSLSNFTGGGIASPSAIAIDPK